MLSKFFIAWLLTGLCVIVHAIGLTALLRWGTNAIARIGGRFWFAIWLLVRAAGVIIFLHLVEITLWGVFYAWGQGMPDFHSACYFSAVTYTTTGYGDLVLSKEWHWVGGIEALTGILMCGWSAAFFFAAVTRMNQMWLKPQ